MEEGSIFHNFVYGRGNFQTVQVREDSQPYAGVASVILFRVVNLYFGRRSTVTTYIGQGLCTRYGRDFTSSQVLLIFHRDQITF